MSKPTQITKADNKSLVALFDETDSRIQTAHGSDYLAVVQVREWIMSELEERDLAAFNEWLVSGSNSPAPFFS